jgi:hypothetical protein
VIVKAGWYQTGSGGGRNRSGWHRDELTRADGNSIPARPFQAQETRTLTMPRGDKSKYTDKQERKADHIAESYENRGVPEQEAERRAWATVNKDDGGGKKSGSGRGADTGHPAAHKGGK